MSNPGSGSGSNLYTDGDVALSNPTNNDVLLYKSGIGKWTNGTVSGGGSGNGTIGINAVPASQTTYIATTNDIGGDIEMYSNTVGGSGSTAGTNSVVIQPQGTGANQTNWPAGANFNVRQMGADITSIAAGSSAVNIIAPNGTRIANPYMTATVVRSSQDTWIVDGGVST